MGRLSRIYIKTSDGNTWFIGPGRDSDPDPDAGLGTSMIIRARNTSGAPGTVQQQDTVRVSLDSDVYTPKFDARMLIISSPYFNSGWQDAAAALVQGLGTPNAVAGAPGMLKYVTSINGVGTSHPGGLFFILGGMCVTPFISDDNPEMDEDRTGVMPRPVSNVLSLTDGCATCKTCDRLLQVKEKLETLKRVFWALKDVNLYKSSIYSRRMTYVRSAMMATPVNCTGVPYEDRNRLFETSMYNMLGQYMTIVHMWNYFNQLGTQRVEILPAPEDACAFVVRIRSPKLSCDDNTKIYCALTIKPKAVQQDLAAWVPYPEIDFEPLHEYAPAFSENISQVGLQYTLHFEDSTPVVGTYIISLRYYPFIPVKAKDPRTAAVVDPATYDTEDYTKYARKLPDDGGYEVVYEGSRVDMELDDDMLSPYDPSWVPPIQDDYIASKRIPAYDSVVTNIWEIQVVWGMYKEPVVPGSTSQECVWQGLDDEEETEEVDDTSGESTINKRRTDIYYYECPAVGLPMHNYTHDLKFHTPSLERDPYMEIREQPDDQEQSNA